MTNTTMESRNSVIQDRELFEYLDRIEAEREDLEYELTEYFSQLAESMREEW